MCFKKGIEKQRVAKAVLEHMPILKHMPVFEHIMSILEHGMPALDQKNSVTEGKNAKIA